MSNTTQGEFSGFDEDMPTPSYVRPLRDGHIYIIGSNKQPGRYGFSILPEDLDLKSFIGEFTLGLDYSTQLPFESALLFLDFAQGKPCAELYSILNNPGGYFSEEP